MIKDLFKISKYFLLPLAIYSLSWIFYLINLFEKIIFLDDIFHFSGGISICYSFYLSLKYFEEKKYLKLNDSFRALFILSLIALIAVFWEFYEFLLKLYFGINTQPNLEDTLLDLFLGISGGLFILTLLKLKHYITSE